MDYLIQPRQFSTDLRVGPSKLYPGVSEYLAGCCTNGIAELGHRSREFSELSKTALMAFREFFKIPQAYKVYYVASSSECWEIITRSCTRVGESSLHIVNGHFGQAWAKTALRLQRQPEVRSAQVRVPLQSIQTQSHHRFLAITANETSTGIAYTPEELQQIREQNPSTTIAVDATSGWGGYAYDISSADIWHLSVQKGLGLPPGLGILIVHEDLVDRLQKSTDQHDIGAHHSLLSLEKKMHTKYQTPTTPNTLGIAGLWYVSTALKSEYGTLAQLAATTKYKADRIRAAVQDHPALELSVDDQLAASNTTVVMRLKSGENTALMQQCAQRDITLSTGYGTAKLEQIRLGMWASVSEADIDAVIAAFDHVRREG